MVRTERLLDPGAVRIYSMYDRKLKEFGPLTTARNDDGILRAVQDGIPGSGSVLERHAEDFDLMYLGDYFPQTGFLAAGSGPPQLVARLDAILARARALRTLEGEGVKDGSAG